MLLSKAGSPAAIAKARQQAGNSPHVPQLSTPIPTISIQASGDDDPSGTNVVLSPKVTLTGNVSTSFGVVYLARGPRGQFTTDTVAANNGSYSFDVVARPGDNLVRVFTASSSFFGVSSQYSPELTYRFVSADPVVGWDAIAVRAIQNQRLAAPEAARDLATLHVAQYDAIASIRSPRSALHSAVAAPKGASEAAAANAAAYSVLSALFPQQASMFDKGLADAKAGLPRTKSTTDGLAVGNMAAASTLAWRAADPTAPFAIANPSTYLPPGPPAAGSAASDAALAEVQAVGGVYSTARTDRQTLTARFWDDFVGTATNPGQWNQAAQRLAVQARTSLRSNARTFAMLDAAMADAGIVSQAAKATYQVLHPQSVIQQADPAWVSLDPTGGDYSYPSDQAAYASAASAVLSSVFGSKTPIEVSSSTLGTSRIYDTIAQAADDAAQGGVYGGVQYSFDVAAGTKLGGSIGQDVLTNFPGKK